MGRLFGWRDPRVRWANRTTGPAVDQTIREELEEVNHFDMVLYRAATARFWGSAAGE